MPTVEQEGVHVITSCCNWTGEDAMHIVLIPYQARLSSCSPNVDEPFTFPLLWKALYVFDWQRFFSGVELIFLKC